MIGTHMKIHINQLINYFENPRHAIGSSEEDTLKKLFDAVGKQYMLNLAEDIQKYGLLNNQEIVVVFSEIINKYIVYEGNRRIAAIKLLQSPDSFSFLERAYIDRAKRISEQGDIPTEIDCYVTNEDEAFFIMERLHSGEDKGRGTKQWTSREKDAFKVRQSHQKKVSFLIDQYCKKYFNGFDITEIIPFTTIERIFNNREVKKKIGIDITNEESFTRARIELIIKASRFIVQESKNSGMAITRYFNKAKTIEDKLLPWIDANFQDLDIDISEDVRENNDYTKAGEGYRKPNPLNETNKTDNARDENHVDADSSDVGSDSGRNSTNNSLGGNRNLPYFFQGINYSGLDPKDADSHGIAEICKELKLFSEKKLVALYPISSAFLVRAVIEQTLIYYSKKHTIQGQSKLIWEDIKGIKNLSSIISAYKKSVNNYIPDENIRKYFILFFDDIGNPITPLNLVVHRPADFRLDANTLIELPRKGLLSIINYMISP